MDDYKNKDDEIKELVSLVEQSDIKFVTKVQLIGSLYKLRKKIIPIDSSANIKDKVSKEESNWMKSL
jgi:hypothetical protein